MLFSYRHFYNKPNFLRVCYNLKTVIHFICRSQWPRGLRRRSAAARLLRLWVRIPPGTCMFVCCECCVLSGGGLCDEMITRPEKSYRLWCVVECDLETSWMRGPWPTGGLLRQKERKERFTGCEQMNAVARILSFVRSNIKYCYW